MTKSSTSTPPANMLPTNNSSLLDSMAQDAHQDVALPCPLRKGMETSAAHMSLLDALAASQCYPSAPAAFSAAPSPFFFDNENQAPQDLSFILNMALLLEDEERDDNKQHAAETRRAPVSSLDRAPRMVRRRPSIGQ
eukprot:CAMPEP_0172443684 /NCGR_PEP_ID=MMETSP1065-20121228/3909_1 /TAXON_ID=265537 /ORGANISM="Amphiprora paludosa, Strain CCMP125" /LENGTH=136 /DNA_ID=CAMNT_0013194001 /DNA_START=36 /DNA_END=446 /DNA_ORIENTATION=+